ncbi:MAG: hypothetical protein KC505_11295 [Myxococcales bacterium]|nr:hypothetical protein [Myxococcales bacterium]USN51170.1 MAG: hypothetical protein H6731_01810 [Myxococcales bacterium]
MKIIFFISILYSCLNIASGEQTYELLRKDYEEVYSPEKAFENYQKHLLLSEQFPAGEVQKDITERLRELKKHYQKDSFPRSIMSAALNIMKHFAPDKPVQ